MTPTPWPLKAFVYITTLLTLGHIQSRCLAQAGLPDTTFDPGSGANDNIYSVAVQPDGKILLGGSFSSLDGLPNRCIGRMYSDGSPDSTFRTGAGANSPITVTLIQTDEKILVGGTFGNINGISRKCIARLMPDGTLDSTFNPGAGANNWVQAMALQSDGNIILGGNFTTYDTINRNRILRLRSDGSLDTTFNPGTGANVRVRAVCVQPDGKIVAAGGFTLFNGVSRSRIVRLNGDGSIDTTFLAGAGTDDWIFSMLLQPDGKLVLGGSFHTANGTSRNGVARLNADGTLDTTFHPGLGADSLIYTLALQPDGKILAGGDFTTYDGLVRNRIVRLNPDGSPDLTFDPGAGPNASPYAMCLQADHRVIIGGQFTVFHGLSRNHVVRLLTDIGTGLFEPDRFHPFVQVYPNPSPGSFTITSTSDDCHSMIIYDALGHVVDERGGSPILFPQTVDLSRHGSGVYIINLLGTRRTQRARIVIE